MSGRVFWLRVMLAAMLTVAAGLIGTGMPMVAISDDTHTLGIGAILTVCGAGMGLITMHTWIDVVTPAIDRARRHAQRAAADELTRMRTEEGL